MESRTRTSGEDMEKAHEPPRVRIPSYEAERQRLGHNAWAQEEKRLTTELKPSDPIDESSEQPAELPQITPTTPKTPKKSTDFATLNPPKQRVNIRPETAVRRPQSQHRRAAAQILQRRQHRRDEYRRHRRSSAAQSVGQNRPYTRTSVDCEN